MARYGAVLDACVLVPIVLADTLLRVAERGLYRPLWSRLILDEAQDAVLAVHPDLDREAVARRFQDMDDTFEDALVTGWEPLLDGIALPDPDDRHVLAAAMRGGAQAIVTSNLKDFPAETLAPLDIAAVHPDAFLLDQLDLAPPVVLDVLREQAAHTRRPKLDVGDVVARLARAGAPGFADEVTRHL
jgi:predicted nucleic acid-binding protein